MAKCHFRLSPKLFTSPRNAGPNPLASVTPRNYQPGLLMLVIPGMVGAAIILMMRGKTKGRTASGLVKLAVFVALVATSASGHAAASASRLS
jgi:hypothetical protein